MKDGRLLYQLSNTRRFKKNEEKLNKIYLFIFHRNSSLGKKNFKFSIEYSIEYSIEHSIGFLLIVFSIEKSIELCRKL